MPCPISPSPTTPTLSNEDELEKQRRSELNGPELLKEEEDAKEHRRAIGVDDARRAGLKFPPLPSVTLERWRFHPEVYMITVEGIKGKRLKFVGCHQSRCR